MTCRDFVQLHVVINKKIKKRRKKKTYFRVNRVYDAVALISTKSRAYITREKTKITQYIMIKTLTSRTAATEYCSHFGFNTELIDY